MSISINIHSKISVLCIYKTKVTNSGQCSCVYLITGKVSTARMEKSMWTLAFKNNEHEIKILHNEKLILFTVN